MGNAPSSAKPKDIDWDLTPSYRKSSYNDEDEGKPSTKKDYVRGDIIDKNVLTKVPCNYVKDWLLTVGDTQNIPKSKLNNFLSKINKKYLIFIPGKDKYTNSREIEEKDIEECIAEINSGEYVITDSRITRPIKIITPKEFLKKHFKEWVESLPDKQRITNLQLYDFIDKFNNTINRDKIYYSGNLWIYDSLISEVIDKINSENPVDAEEIGLESSLKKATYDTPSPTQRKYTKPLSPNLYEEKKSQLRNTLNVAKALDPNFQYNYMTGNTTQDDFNNTNFLLNFNPTKLLELFNELDTVSTSKGNVNILPKVDESIMLNVNKEYKAEDISGQLKRGLSPFYAKVLVLFLKVFKKNLRVDISSLCSENLEFVEEIYLVKSDTMDYKFRYKIANVSKLLGEGMDLKYIQHYYETIIKQEDLTVFLQKFPDIVEEDKKNISEEITPWINATQASLKNIKEEFAKCTNQYYIIPFVTKRLINNGHQNLIILDKLHEHAIYIEPQYYGTTNPHGQYISELENKRLNIILKELGIPEYQKILPITPYPQSITEDVNCMFWTFLITVTFLLNPGVESPDTIAQAINKKYPDKESLIKYIESFRTILGKFFNSFTSRGKGGKKRRRTYRKRKSTSRRRTVSKSYRS